MKKTSPGLRLELGREKADGDSVEMGGPEFCLYVCQSVDRVVAVSRSQPELGSGGHLPREDGWNYRWYLDSERGKGQP